MTRLELLLGGCCVFLVGCQAEETQWYNAKFDTEKSLLDAVYGQIFGGDAVNTSTRRS